MKHFASIGAIFLLLFSSAIAADDLVYVRLTTSKGVIDVALNKTKAPITVENFLAYEKRGYYTRMVFHRVIADTLIQTGGYNSYLFERSKLDPIQNEADNGLKNVRGTLGMARYDDPNSARSQFYINLRDNTQLDHTSKSDSKGWGYAVFGEVVAGMAVADAIGAVPTMEKDDFLQFPVEPIILQSVDVITADEAGSVSE